jgi:hypothetical protein
LWGTSWRKHHPTKRILKQAAKSPQLSAKPSTKMPPLTELWHYERRGKESQKKVVQTSLVLPFKLQSSHTKMSQDIDKILQVKWWITGSAHHPGGMLLRVLTAKVLLVVSQSIWNRKHTIDCQFFAQKNLSLHAVCQFPQHVSPGAARCTDRPCYRQDRIASETNSRLTYRQYALVQRPCTY